jgi:hypothetical protein
MFDAMKRKTIILLLIVIFFTTDTYCQLTKGFWLFGGNGSIISSSTTFMNTSYKYSSIILKPRAGYFIINNLALGLNLEYNYSKSGIGSPLITSSQAIGIGPFIRYYFLSEGKRYNLLGELNGNYNKNINSKDGYYQYSFLGGLAIFLNSSVAVEILPGYQGSNSIGSPNKSVSKNFIMNIGLQVHLERDRE